MSRIKVQRKFLALFLGAVSLLGLATPAMANNYKDTGWSGNLYPWRNRVQTEPRAKTDKSPVYVLLNYRSNNGVTWAWAEAPTSTNVGTSVISIKELQPRHIDTYIYEKGYRQALAAFSDGNNDSAIVGINGVWSPDTYGY